MQFALTYRGPLKSNARPNDKHELRRHFHRQIRSLWSVYPLSEYTEWLTSPPTHGEVTVIRERHGFRFAPLVCEGMRSVAELDITLLWPQAPGAIFKNGGDIDNRLKTLFDALKMPSEPTALPPGTVPQQDETPFFCLLEDDSLISRVNVNTERLLEPVQSPSEVALLVHVKTRNLGATYDALP